MKAIVVCNGSVEDYSYYKKYFDDAQFLICADGGANHLRRFGVNPDVLLGDFDSISNRDLDCFKAMGVEIMQFPAEKDATDTELAVDVAMNRGYTSITVIGGLGSRFDHSLSNIFLLKKMMERGVEGRVVNEHNEIMLIKDRISIDRDEGFNISLLPLTSRVEGVTTRGLYYPLDHATMTLGTTWGVSNKFTAEKAEITVSSGLLLVIKSRD